MKNISRNDAFRNLCSDNAAFASLFNLNIFDGRIKPEELMIPAIDYSCLKDDPQLTELSETVEHCITKAYGRCDLVLLGFFRRKVMDYYTQYGKVMLESLCARQQLLEWRDVGRMRPVIIMGIYLGTEAPGEGDEV